MDKEFLVLTKQIKGYRTAIEALELAYNVLINKVDKEYNKRILTALEKEMGTKECEWYFSKEDDYLRISLRDVYFNIDHSSYHIPQTKFYLQIADNNKIKSQVGLVIKSNINSFYQSILALEYDINHIQEMILEYTSLKKLIEEKQKQFECKYSFLTRNQFNMKLR